MHTLFRTALLGVCSASACLAQGVPFAGVDDDFGVLVMAHGGSEAWDEAVLEAVAPLGDEYPLEVAFGMADAATIQEAVAKLEARGVKRIGVVRLFISGESWYDRTREILGLIDGAPERPAAAAEHDHSAESGHSMAFWRIETDASFALSRDGLANADRMGAVLADRARRLSRDPTHEDVLILAHGPEDDAENTRWLAHIDAQADAVRASLPFRRVRVETLREDWPDKRAVAEARIREFVRSTTETGGRAIAIPFRVQGFGPYADVLEGLDYAADGQGLLPHEAVTGWIRRETEALQSASFERSGH